MTKPVTVRERVRELVQQHGSYRKAAEAVGISFAHLWEMGKGTERTENTKLSTLSKLGLKVGPKFDRA